jgi:hypothetical protein
MLGLSRSNLAKGGALTGKPANQSAGGTLKRMSDCLTVSDSMAGLRSLGLRNRLEGILMLEKRLRPNLNSSYCVWFAWGLPRLNNAPSDLLHDGNFVVNSTRAVSVVVAIQNVIDVKILS